MGVATKTSCLASPGSPLPFGTDKNYGQHIYFVIWSFSIRKFLGYTILLNAQELQVTWTLQVASPSSLLYNILYKIKIKYKARWLCDLECTYDGVIVQ